MRHLLRGALVLCTLAAVVFPGCGGSGGSGGSAPDTVVESSYTTQTADDWTIALHRYRKSSGVTHPEPVFMSQGYLESQKVMHAFTKHSLVDALAMEGFDVWTYDVRGTGDSQQPVIDWTNIDFTIDWTNLSFSWGMAGWDYSIDHFILLDTPAALNFVLNFTGASQVMWIGHSMGALMMYASLQTELASKVRAAVSLGGIGAPLAGTDYQSLFAEIFYAIGTFLAPLLPSNLPLPLRWAVEKLCGNDPQKWALLSYALDTVGGKLFWNHENMNANLVYQFLKYMLPNTTTNCFKQWLKWGQSGDCVCDGVTMPSGSTGGATGAGNTGFGVTTGTNGSVVVGQGYSYTQNLNKITKPMLILSGGADFMCPPSHCVEVFNRISSPDKSYIECSKATGHSVDYGHVDMTMGLFARTEVYPHITQWLKARASQ